MKKLIEIPGDGNCLFNSILLGYIDTNNGQYPVINGVAIRTQQQLRQAIQNYYQNILDGANNESRQELIQTIRNELIGVISQGNFQGFNSNSVLVERLQNIRKIINAEADEGIRPVTLLEQINEDLIKDYIISLNAIWGGEPEINALRIILHHNIRLSGHGNPLDNEIELMYVGENHYHVYVNHSDNAKVSQFIEQIKRSQSSRERLSFSTKQTSKIEGLSESEFHLLPQIIFNKREAEHIDVNESIGGEEINDAIKILNDLRLVEASVNRKSQNPCFVLNCPMYVPDDSSDDGYESDYSAIDLPENFDPSRKDSYFIAKWALDGVETVDSDYNPDRNSKHISVLIDKLRKKGLEEHDIQYQPNIGIVIGLNRPKSLSNKKNRYLDKELSSFQNNDHEKVFGFRWQYKWMEKHKTKKDAFAEREVDYKKVLEFYKKLKKYDINLAKQFRDDNERDVKIPYSLIRETIKNHLYTKEIIKLFQMQGHYVIYLSIIDSDTMNFNGVYSAYMRIISKYQQPTIMSTGYIFSDDPKQRSEMQGIIPILSFGSQVDRLVRIITAREFPLGVYYPEPNFCILISAGAETVDESFIDKYVKEPRESIDLIKKVKDRICFKSVFVDDKPLITRIPDRVYYKKHKAKEQFEFSQTFLQGIYARGTQEDFENLASMAQSHLGGNNWALSFIGIEKPNKAEVRKSGLERLLNTYREYQFQERVDAIERINPRTELRDSGLTEEQINKIENIMEIVTNAAYVFVTEPNIDVYEFLEFLNILFDFSYETKIPKNEIRAFYLQYKELFDMALLSDYNVARIVRYCGIELLEDDVLDNAMLERIEPHLDDIERNGVGISDEEGESQASTNSSECEKRKNLIHTLIKDPVTAELEGFIPHFCEALYNAKQHEECYPLNHDEIVDIAKSHCYEDGCPDEILHQGIDADRDSNNGIDDNSEDLIYVSFDEYNKSDELINKFEFQQHMRDQLLSGIKEYEGMRNGNKKNELFLKLLSQHGNSFIEEINNQNTDNNEQVETSILDNISSNQNVISTSTIIQDVDIRLNDSVPQNITEIPKTQPTIVELVSNSQVSNTSEETTNQVLDEQEQHQDRCGKYTIMYVYHTRYNNIILNNPHFLQIAFKFYGKEAINLLIELGEDKDLAEQILLSIDELGTEKLLEIFFGDKVKTSEQEKITNAISVVQLKTQEDQILETIAQIEASIGKEALSEIAEWHQYLSKALSNSPLSVYATKVIQVIGNLVSNLEEWLDYSALYESIDIDNHVTIILSQLEYWVDFAASGHMHIGMPPRHPGFGPDFDPNGGFGGGGQGMIYSGDDGNQDSQPVTLFIGHNATSFDA
jgi:hypothetical protein